MMSFFHDDLQVMRWSCVGPKLTVVYTKIVHSQHSKIEDAFHSPYDVLKCSGRSVAVSNHPLLLKHQADVMPVCT